ncbi:hypothetical protein [Clostridium sardiniense]|uniref:hypothetical protein n=1 Tax=Clostridium sardiniense TaxID=29369 RepID=UPI00195CF774|nr:hypothetical protein [Clostridium sardiniense]MBM7835964.1 hypothetical protein [Clostridium sardiniense]
MGILDKLIKKENKKVKKILTTNQTNIISLFVVKGATQGLYRFELNKEGIGILKPMKFKPFITLKYEDIEDIEVSVIDKETSKGKSVVGRAIVGGMVAGGLGSVVGALSATNGKHISLLDVNINIKIKDGKILELEGKDIKGDAINNIKTFIKFLQYNISEEDISNNLF